MKKYRQVIGGCGVAAMLAIVGCSPTGIDYRTADDREPAGAPMIIQAEVTGSMSAGADISSVDWLDDTRLLALAPGDEDGSGALMVIDTGAEMSTETTTAAATDLYDIEVGSQYLDAIAVSPQVRRAWSVSVSSDGSAAIATGDRYGVLADPQEPATPENYGGLYTTDIGSPITPVTGSCQFDDPDAGVLTVDGSDVLTRRAVWALGNSDGRDVRVSMRAGDWAGVREEAQQESVWAARPQVTPTPTLHFGGLTELDCLSADQVSDLGSAGVPALRQGTGSVAVAVIDRGLNDDWYDSGVKLAEVDGHDSQGRHHTGSLIAEPVLGDNRLDAVVVDLVTGAATAGIHVAGLADDAQVRAFVLDNNDPLNGWISIAGDDRLYEIRLSLV